MKGYGFKFLKRANMISQRWSPSVAIIENIDDNIQKLPNISRTIYCIGGRNSYI